MSEQEIKGLKGGRYLLLLLLVVVVTLFLGRIWANLYTEILWYSTTGFSSVYWTRFAAEGAVRVAAGGLTVLMAYLNFRVVGRTLGELRIKRRFGNLEIAERLPERAISMAMGGISLLLGLWIGASFPRGGGLRLLLFLKAPEWGLEAPYLGQDISFFVFGVPILGGILVLFLALSFLLLSFSAAGYAASGSLSFRGGKPTIAPLPRKHLAVLGGIFLLILAGRFWLSPYLLLMDGNSGVQGIFGFADASARIPGYRLLALLTVAGAFLTWWAGFKKRLIPLLAGGLAIGLGGLILVQLYPEVLQRWRVEPNELARETPYIESALEFTRMGFGLDDLQQTRFAYRADAQPDWGDAASQFAGLPIWTTPTLLTTFQEVEARFRYYDFEEVAIDRYPSSQGMVPVALAVREVDPGGIEDPNWQNLHLRPRFLAGMGAVASKATERTPEGRPAVFLSGIPPVWAEGEGVPGEMALTDPAVVFGSRPQRYAILNPGLGAGAGASTEDPASLSQVAGSVQGISLRGFLRKVAFAWQFRDANLLFASEVSDESVLVFRRSVLERANAVAPFLRFFEAPYPVVDGGRIVWILEGFTTTRSFPLSAVQNLPGAGIATYVRNSVKITVDAVTGELRLYRVDPEDPLLEAWSRVFPELLLPLEEMPEVLRSHIRYPRSLLELQARVLLQYHQETAPRFHGQQDVWALPQELAQGTRPVAYRPEYGLYRLPGETEAEFLLSTVFVPAGRQNLTGILVARSDPEHYGELHLLDIPVEEQVPGPRQIEVLLEQDPIISQELSLWRQGGSQVWSGHLHVIPIGETVLYLEPIFLAADGDAIPELRRFVVSDGRRVVMEETLAAAISALARAAGDESPDMSSFLGSEQITSPPGSWPREALDLLDQAEQRLRDGDWTGFGAALEELRTLLRNLSVEGGLP